MAANFEIVTQSQSQDVGPAGILVDVMRVTLKTKPHAIESTISVPLDNYTPDAVAALAEARATAIEAVEAL